MSGLDVGGKKTSGGVEPSRAGQGSEVAPAQYEHRLAREIKSAIVSGLERRLRLDSLKVIVETSLSNPDNLIALILQSVVSIAEDEIQEVLERHNLLGGEEE